MTNKISPDAADEGSADGSIPQVESTTNSHEPTPQPPEGVPSFASGEPPPSRKPKQWAAKKSEVPATEAALYELQQALQAEAAATATDTQMPKPAPGEPANVSKIWTAPTGGSTRAIRIADLDRSLQVRVGTSAEKVSEYAERQADGDVFPPPVVFESPDGVLLVADGYHTLAAHEKRGGVEAEVGCLVHKGDRSAALLYAAQANSKHGLAMTTADKRRAVAQILPILGDAWSNRAIGEHVGVSHAFVGMMKREAAEAAKMETVSKAEGESSRTGHKPAAKSNAKMPEGDEPVLRFEPAGASNGKNSQGKADDDTASPSENPVDLTSATLSLIDRVRSALADAPLGITAGTFAPSSEEGTGDAIEVVSIVTVARTPSSRLPAAVRSHAHGKTPNRGRAARRSPCVASERPERARVLRGPRSDQGQPRALGG